MKYATLARRRTRAFHATTPVAAAVAALLCAAAAQAQTTADASAAQTITVTGIRRGIESSISTKKNSDAIVESVSAEDIGKLPDVSIAESIARLPGVAAQRVNGRANGISVRGFAPDFSTALLNGREQVSTGDSRYVEFDQYPSELMSQVTIYKTPDASLIGQGLSATIDMRTVRPLDLNARAIAVNYRKEKLGTGLSTPEGSGSRFNLSYIDQFADRTLGISIGYARLKETTGVSQNYGSWGTSDVTFNGVKATAPGGFNDLVDKTEQTRDAVMATLQYKPNKNFQSTIDVFYTKFDQSLLEQGVQVPLAFADGNGYGPATFTAGTASGGNWVTGTYSNAKPLSRNDSKAIHDKVHSIGWNNQLTVGEWTGALDLAASEAKRQAADIQTTASLVGNCKTTPAACSTVSWTGFNGIVSNATYTTLPGLTTAANQLTDSEGWGGNIVNGASTTPQAGYSSQPLTDDKLNQYRLNAKRALPEGLFFSDVDFGLNYSDRNKTRTYIEGRLLVGTTGNPFAAAPVPGASTVIAPTSGLPYLAWNPDGSIGSVYSVASKLVSDIANKNWKVTEKATAAFARLDIDNTLAGMPLRGNAGVQLIHTDQSSDAYQATKNGAACPGDVCALTVRHVGTSYYDLLPSMNLVGDLGSGQLLRLGAGRQMARPTLNDMRASFNFSYDSTAKGCPGSVNGSLGCLTGTAGNPELKPFRATALDLSYEKYFGTKAYFSAALFYKKLSSYILTVGSDFDYSGYDLSAAGLPNGNVSKAGLLSRPINGTGGNVNGLELTASLPFSMATSWLDGFGIQASFSQTNSSLDLNTLGFDTAGITLPSIPLPGLSKQVGNLTLYFEKYGFSARVGQRYRSDFLGNITSFTGDKQYTFIHSEKITDAQISYEFEGGPLKGLSVLFQANNLTNTPYIEFLSDRNNPSKKVTYGKTYLFGLNYKL